MKPITFENQINREQVICDDVRKEQSLDGILYLTVHRIGERRTFLMRKDSLRKIDQKVFK